MIIYGGCVLFWSKQDNVLFIVQNSYREKLIMIVCGILDGFILLPVLLFFSSSDSAYSELCAIMSDGFLEMAISAGAHAVQRCVVHYVH